MLGLPIIFSDILEIVLSVIGEEIGIERRVVKEP
jgi:hypothetical protein